MLMFSLAMKPVSAQTNELEKKNRNNAMLEQKKYENEGWKSLDPTRIIAEQLIASWRIQSEETSEGYPKYICASSSVKAKKLNVAFLQAKIYALQDLVTMAAESLKDGVTLSYDTTIHLYKIEKMPVSYAYFMNLFNITPLLSMYRKVENGYEVSVFISMASNLNLSINQGPTISTTSYLGNDSNSAFTQSLIIPNQLYNFKVNGEIEFEFSNRIISENEAETHEKINFKTNGQEYTIGAYDYNLKCIIFYPDIMEQAGIEDYIIWELCD